MGETIYVTTSSNISVSNEGISSDGCHKVSLC